MIQTGDLNRQRCGHCGSDNTEFIDFADGSEQSTQTKAKQVGDGLLELRVCNDCGAAIENVLDAVRKDSFHP